MDLFSSTDGVATLKTTNFPSVEIPSGVILPNFQSNSGDSTCCADALKPMILMIIKTIFFILISDFIDSLKVAKYFYKKSHTFQRGFKELLVGYCLINRFEVDPLALETSIK